MADAIPSWEEADVAAAAHAMLRELADRDDGTDAPRPGAFTSQSDAFMWIRARAFDLGFVAEVVDFYQADAANLLRSSIPTLFIPFPRTKRVFAVVRSKARSTVLLAPRHPPVTARTSDVMAELCGASIAAADRVAAALVEGAPGASRSRLGLALTAELGRHTRIGSGITFRRSVLTAEARRSSVSSGRGAALGLMAAAALQSLLTTVAWAIIGSLALSGHADTGSLFGWAILSVAASVIQVTCTGFVGRITVRAATIMRQRLIEGALRLDPDGLGSFGVGGLVVIASQADSFLNLVVALALSVLAVSTNLVGAVVVLGLAPLPVLTVGVFGAFVLLVVAFVPRVARACAAQQAGRMRLTTEMVERMLGHRTRLVQSTPGSWHDGEDESVHAYANTSRALDRNVIFLRALPRAFYLASLVAVFFVLVAQPRQEALALTIGGMVLGTAAIGALVELVINGGALLALWKAIQPLVENVTGEPASTLDVASATASHDDDASGGSARPVLELRRVRFEYEGRSRPVFDDANLTIRSGDHVLVEGPSGGGKTTLASLLTGLRKPSSGLMLVRGLDQHSIGESDLRRIVASAPQFYKNHVFTESLAFNLLLGRSWPATREDVSAARETAKALGLGPLLDRMPAELFQQVGETGWQLSHGERSRVFLARTLLQRSEVVVLDETFGALDPATMRECMRVVLERAKTVVVITHR